MKFIILLCCTILLFSCKKNEIVLSDQYRAIIGTWSGYNGTEKLSLVFDKNGLVETIFENERGYRFKVEHFDIKSSNIPNYNTYILERKYNKGKRAAVGFLINTSLDTIQQTTMLFKNGDHFALDFTEIFLTRETE